jgi:hypothetical protein
VGGYGSGPVGLVHHLLGDVAELDVAVRGGPNEEGEGPVLGQVVSPHDQPDGLADDLPRLQRFVEVLTLADVAEGNRCVGREQVGQGFGVGVDVLVGGGVQIQTAQGAPCRGTT